MSKRNKNKRNKSQILQARHVFNQSSGSESTTGTAVMDGTNQPVNQATDGVKVYSASAAATAVVGNDRYHLHHVFTDLRFFYLTSALLAIILTAVYFWNQSSGIILTAGQELYKFLGI